MQIVINHLTRMQQGYICAAGFDAAGRHVRPVLPNERLTADLLMCHGGPFEMGAVVDIGSVRPAGQPPEMEDHEFAPAQARFLRFITADKFRPWLQRLARPRLRDVFGSDLVPIGDHSAGVNVGSGCASLGCFVPQNLPLLFFRHRPGKHSIIRILVKDADFDLDLGVTDVRLYREDHVTPDPVIVQRACIEMCRQQCILGVGLTRPYQKPGDTKPMHWLQVNNIHLLNDLLWRVGSHPAPEGVTPPPPPPQP